MVSTHGIGSMERQAEADFAHINVPRFEHVSWYREPHLRRLYLLSIGLMIASATTGFDGSLVNASQQIKRWENFFGDSIASSSDLGLLINMFNLGSIASFFITPSIADHYGRKTAIVIGCSFMIVGGLLTGLCNGYGMYIAGRFSLGFGNSLSQMASPLLLIEISHPQFRGPVTAIYNCLWNLGALMVSSMAWATASIASDWSWRSITLAQIVPSVIQLMLIWWIPESPRYLIAQDRNEEALNTLAKHHAGGDRRSAVVQFQYHEIKETIQMERVVDTSTSYLDFFRTRGNRWRLAILLSLGVISQYSGNALFSNYINIVYEGAGITQQSQKLALSTGKTVLDLIVTIAAALNVDRFGRRPLFLVSTCGMVACFAAWTVSNALYENSNDTNAAAGVVQLVCIWTFGVFYDIGFSGLLVAYALEILPYSLRAKGLMIMNLVIQAVLALGNQTNKLAWDNLGRHWHFTLIYTIWDFIELIFVWFFYVETKGPTLEEVSGIFDGDDTANHIDLHSLDKTSYNESRDDDTHSAYMRRQRTSDV